MKLNEIKLKRPHLIGLFVGFCLLLCSVSFLGGYFYGNGYTQLFKTELPILKQVSLILSDHALNPLPDATASEYGMIRGLLQMYGDPYTVFVEPPQTELQSNTLQGSFGGIGARIERDSNQNFRLYALPGSPALEAGVQDADILLQADNLTITPETSVEAVQAALRGPEGSSVEITILREPAQTTHEISIKRKEIALPSATWNLLPEDPKIGIIRVHVIAATSAEEISAAIEEMSDSGATTFILDLRNNSGGLVDEGIEIARLFLSKDDAVLEQQYRDQEIETFRALEDGPLVNNPLYVFVNNGTASSAEIVAGALKNHNRALIIGQPTFGKDSIQLVFDLQDGSSLHVTAAKWRVPGLEPPIQGNGLQPDIYIDPEPPEEQDSRYYQAVIDLASEP